MKKKLTLVVCALIVAASLWAQDIIVTQNAQKIEAKILEVSKTEIKYKEKANLNGPIFIMETKEINSIIYSNGKVVLYNQEQTAKVSTSDKQLEEKPAQVNKQIESQTIQSAQSIDDNTVEILLLSGKTIVAPIITMNSTSVSCVLNGKEEVIPASQIEKVTFLANGQVKEYHGISPTNNTVAQKEVAPKCVTRKGNTYYYDGRAMNEDSYSTFLQNNCPNAYDMFNSGNKIACAGWVLFSVGVGADIGTLISYFIVGRNTANTVSGIIGLGCEIACIPTLIVGYTKKHRSVDIFNSSCANKKSVAYWSINASQNGLGIAYNF